MRNTTNNYEQLLFTLIICFLSLKIDAQQICNGSLGDNIFTDGDFGMGQSPTLGVDPKIAPGYRYSTRVPADGEYSVTKNTGNLAGLYGSWLRVQDNSGTPDGYYMVVNASFSPGIFYEKTIDNLCGNTTYEFSADMINLIKINPNPPHSDPNVNFLLDDVVKYGTGDIPKTEKWITYGFTFTTSPGQNSIKLTLRNNAPGGIGNDLGLDNITFRACGPASFVGLSTDTTKFLCVDGKPFALRASVSNNLKNYFLWQISSDNKIWTDLAKGRVDSIIHKTFTPANYYYRYYSAGDSTSIENTKCRVLSDVVHIEVLPEVYVKYDTLCQNNIMKFGSKQLTTSGYYVETFISSRNCDSTVQLYLTVLPDPSIAINTVVTDPSCYGYKDGNLDIQSIAGGSAPYQVIYNGKVQSSIITNLESDTTEIFIKDRYGCLDSFKYVLTELEEFQLEDLVDTTIVFGDVLDFNLIANKTVNKIAWNPSELFSCATCASTTATINKTRTISATATSIAGCIDSISFLATVNRDQTFFVSNILKTNTDINSNFILQSYKSAVKEVVKMVVYDRYGNIINQAEKLPYDNIPLVLWNGKVSDTQLKEGVFTYFLEIKLIDDTTIKKYGDLTILH